MSEECRFCRYLQEGDNHKHDADCPQQHPPTHVDHRTKLAAWKLGYMSGRHGVPIGETSCKFPNTWDLGNKLGEIAREELFN